MSPNRIETAEQLDEIVEKQNAAIKEMGELVKGMDARIKLLSGLQDSQYEILVRHGLAKPRPAGGSSLAN